MVSQGSLRLEVSLAIAVDVPRLKASSAFNFFSFVEFDVAGCPLDLVVVIILHVNFILDDRPKVRMVALPVVSFSFNDVVQPIDNGEAVRNDPRWAGCRTKDMGDGF